jgi:SagB-type dehydrogenase family enzyme
MRLRPDVYVATGADGQVALLHGTKWGEHLGVLTTAENRLLRELGAREHPESELHARLTAREYDLLRRLHAGGWLTVKYEHSDRPLVTFLPLGPHRDPRPAPIAAARLSRFAVLRREGDDLLLESPLARAAVVVHDTEVVAMIHRLAGPGDGLLDTRLPPSVISELLTELSWYGFVHEAEEDVRPNLAIEQWSPHELWFHSRSRAGYHDLPFGRTQWASGKYPQLPERREPWSGTAVGLPEPTSEAPTGPPLSAVLEAGHGGCDGDENQPLTLTQLGEFLHWTARVRPATAGASPCGLEVYPIVTNVTGLAAGMYHYDPFDHVLEPVPASEFASRQLVGRAGAAAGSTHPPQVLLVISARFGRVMWNYQSMAYALILKDLGALMQTMYLVATSMGLTPCALASGDVELFAQATGLNQLIEASVGEFTLSSGAT